MILHLEVEPREMGKGPRILQLAQTFLQHAPQPLFRLGSQLLDDISQQALTTIPRHLTVYTDIRYLATSLVCRRNITHGRNF